MQLNVEPDPAEVGRARRWARSRLTGSGIGPDEPLAEALVLIVSELVTNAVVHTGCPAVLRMCVPAGPGGHCEDGTVRIEVADSSGRPPVPRRAGGDDSGAFFIASTGGVMPVQILNAAIACSISIS